MKIRILLSLIFCSFIFCIKAQAITVTVKGESTVCSKGIYRYTVSLPDAAALKTSLPVFIYGGYIAGAYNSIGYVTIDKGLTSGTIDVEWDDTPMGNASVIVQTTGYYGGLSNITVVSMKNTKVKSVSCSQMAIGSDNTISIPYGQTGSLTFTASASYPYTSESKYVISSFEWKFAGNSTNGNSTFTINYGTSDLDDATITVTPIGRVCYEQYGAPTTITIKRTLDAKIISTTPSPFCKRKVIQFNISGFLPSGKSIYWIPANYFKLTAGQGYIFSTYEATAAGTEKIGAVVRVNGKSFTIQSAEMTVSDDVVSGTYTQKMVQKTLATVNGLQDNSSTVTINVHQPGATKYTWTSNVHPYNWNALSDKGNVVSFIPNGASSYQFIVTSYDGCGTTTAQYNFIPNMIGLNSVSVYPNPVNEELTVQINEDSGDQLQIMTYKTMSTEANIASEPVYDIRLYNDMGKLVRQISSKDNLVRLNVAGLDNGVYFLHVYSGNNVNPEIQKIIVNNK